MEKSTCHEKTIAIYKALQENGYRPIEQLIGYILTEDPTYITNHADARKIAYSLTREELLQDIVFYYFQHE